MHGIAELFLQRSSMFGRCAGDQHALIVIQQFGGNFDDLLRSFAGAENNLGKATAQCAVSIDLGKSKVRNRRRLKRLQQFVPANTAGAELLQKSDGFRRGHAPHDATAKG